MIKIFRFVSLCNGHYKIEKFEMHDKSRKVAIICHKLAHNQFKIPSIYMYIYGRREALDWEPITNNENSVYGPDIEQKL